jgi:hypothetical protein
VKLSGGVKETRSVTDRDRALCRIAELSSEVVEESIDLGSLLDVVQERDVITGLDRDGAGFRFGACFQMPAALESVEQFFSRVFRFLNVGLIEWIDSESPAGYCRCKLPDKELCT